MDSDESYQQKIESEKTRFASELDVHALPAIFHYWSHKYVRPLLEEAGVGHPDEFFAKFLDESAQATRRDAPPVFLSIGAGNCDTEVRVARLLLERQLSNFTIECLDLSPVMLERGRELAAREGVERHLRFTEGDFNRWKSSHAYDGVMANQSLHHVLNLEGLFDEVKLALAPGAGFVVSDMIGRNGHQRWPEALAHVERFWSELPLEFRHNMLLDRHEEEFVNWDCSVEGFEGIRAQDILPLLLERFNFQVFIGFGNVVDPFVDRCFGHHLDGDGKWDQRFIDRIHAVDEKGFRDGSLTPTHMMAVLKSSVQAHRIFSRGLTPEASVRQTA